MGMGGNGNKGRGGRGVLSEINVTPMVDVMLVLLIIFMVAAGVQTVEQREENERLLDDARDKLEEAEELLAQAEIKNRKHEKVEIDLPKVNSEAVNLSEVKKLKLEVDGRLRFRIGRTKLLDCLKVSPAMAPFVGLTAAGPGGKTPPTPAPGAGNAAAKDPALTKLEAFEPCLKLLGDKLVDNAKLQEDKELYLLADRSLDYGIVLRIMAAVRQAGVTKFGLVAEPDLLGEVKSEKTAPAVP